MPTPIDKRAAKEIVDSLPDDATWEDLIYGVFARSRIERGLADSRAGRVQSVEAVRRSFGLED